MLRLFRYLKPFRAPLAAALALTFLSSLSNLYLPALMSGIVDRGIVHGDTAYILRIGALMVLISGFGIVFAAISGYFSARVSMGFGRDLRSRVFERVEGFSLREFDRIGTPSLITRTTNDVTQVQTVTMMMLSLFVTAPIMGIGGIIMAVTTDAGLSWVLAVVVPLLAGFITLIGTKALPLFRTMQARIDKINLVLREGMTGIRVVRAFDRNDYERQRFASANLDLTETAIKVNRLMAFMMPLMMLVMNLTTVAIIWFGGIRIDTSQMEVGRLMAFIQYATQILFSLLMMSFMFVMLPRASASAARIQEVLSIDPEIEATPRAHGGDGQKGYLEFRGVAFGYPGASEPAISDISFRASPGEVTAIIGGTGSGKSTLVNLIPRFYDPDRGSILVDGRDIRELSREELRSRIGFVPQRAVLFSGSVADNIRYGRESASDEELAHAAQTAQAAEFIRAMPEGYQTPIAQGGTNLSGGQRQRLAIARALVRRPEIYVFDDTFSALDFKTDSALRRALRRETAGATVIIVAQRVNTVMDADRILVLEDGRLVGVGTHGELLASCAVYREIVSSQLPEEAMA